MSGRRPGLSTSLTQRQLLCRRDVDEGWLDGPDIRDRVPKGFKATVIGSTVAHSLMVIASRGSKATHPASLPLPASGQYYINVHASPNNM